jgi:hypothetical protein
MDRRGMEGRCEPDSPGSGWGLLAGYCEHGDELAVSIKTWEFLDC